MTLLVAGLAWASGPGAGGEAQPFLASAPGVVEIVSVSPAAARPGEPVTIYGAGFGARGGHVFLAGLRVVATRWSDRRIDFTVPAEAATGALYVRDGRGTASSRVAFTVKRDLPRGQFGPVGLRLADLGLPGAAFLVETDGQYLYGVTGFERLVTCKMGSPGPYRQCSSLYLPQRVSDLRIHGGYLFVAGDHGLFVYRCTDLQQGRARVTAALAGLSLMTVDVRAKTGPPVPGTVIALCEYRPRPGTNQLRVPLYRFQGGELEKLGEYGRAATKATERQHAVAVDPLLPKVYVSGYETLLGNDKYILEIDISNPAAPVAVHRENTGSLLAFDMDTVGSRLWTGVVDSGFTFFQAYKLQPAPKHLLLDETVTGNFGLGRTTRLKVVDGNVTVGSAWSGARPDLLLLNTFRNGARFQAQANTIDWAFDVTGFPPRSPQSDGKIIVADEWAGFLTFEYRRTPSYTIGHQPDYRSVMAGAMTDGLHLTDDRIYVAGRGAGPWSADRFALANESDWRRVAWDWTRKDPQPHPVSAVCTRVEPGVGTLIAALGHEKAMAWGQKIYGILYRETARGIARLALSAEIDPPGLSSTGIGAVWPEKDLVYMTTGTDGFRAFVVDPGPAMPSITIHKDCRSSGFASAIFGGSNKALCMKYHASGPAKKLIVGSELGFMSTASGLTFFDLRYPSGVPDRANPNRTIVVSKENELGCLKGKTVHHVDVSPSGLVAAATSQGLALFHISWVPYLNALSPGSAWNRIRVAKTVYSPWWDPAWSAAFRDASFDGDQTVYALKMPVGVWKLDVRIDWRNRTHACTAVAYYPGVECGLDYNNLLPGWGNPDIPTLHHPYALVAGSGSVYVTGWSGKVWELTGSR